MKDMPIRMEFKWEPKGSMKNLNPYTIYFVYPRGDEPFRLIGGLHEIEDWLDYYKVGHSYLYHKVCYGVNPSKFAPRRRKNRVLDPGPDKVHKYVGAFIVSEKYEVIVRPMIINKEAPIKIFDTSSSSSISPTTFSASPWSARSWGTSTSTNIHWSSCRKVPSRTYLTFKIWDVAADKALIFPKVGSKEDLILFKTKRPPRCFPRQLLPFCDDHLNEEFIRKGLLKENA